MTATFPLQPLLELSRNQLDDAARKLGQLIAGEEEASKRYHLLVTYREEYQARFMEAAKNGLSPREWSNYNHFLARIDDAIIPASLSVTTTQQRTLAGQQNWQGRQGRVKAFNTLSDRHHAQISAQEQRAEQKINDEHTAKRYNDKNSNADK